MSKKQPDPIELDIDEQKVAEMMGPPANEIRSAAEEALTAPPVLPDENPVTLVGQNDEGVYKIASSDQSLEEISEELAEENQ